MAQNGRKILFIVIDQLRADCLNGALSNSVDLPNLRALQADAVSFRNHFTVTNPCGPARASLLTGKYAMNHRSVRNGTPLVKGTPSIASETRKAGYEPLLFGYTDTTLDPTDLHPADPRVGKYEMVMEGFNEITEMRFDESFPWRADLKAKGYDIPAYADFYNPVPASGGAAAEPDDPAFYSAEDSDTAFLTDRLLKELAVRTDQSWFAHLTYIRPHPPLVAPAPYNKMYDPAALPATTAPSKEHPFTTLANQKQPIHRFVKGCRKVDDTDAQVLRAIYLGLATEVDHHIGRIISFLKDSGQYDDTLIVVTADHGEMLGDHGLWGKQHVFDPSFQVSLIIRDPDQPAAHGTTVQHLTESIDVTPTILDWLGQPVPQSMNGFSLRPFLTGDAPKDWREYVHLEQDFAGADRATLDRLGIHRNQANFSILRGKRFKLVHFSAVFAPLLFDLQADPLEQTDLAVDPAHAGVLLQMTQELLSYRMSFADQSLSELPDRF